MALLQIVPDVTGSRFLKMAASKPEVVMSLFLDRIATPFQRLTPIFGVQQLNGTIANTVLCNRKYVFKDGGRQTGSTYISASRQDSNSISTANPLFAVQQLNSAIANIVLYISTTGLAAAIFKNRLPVTSDSICNGAIELLKPENEGQAVEISFLGVTEAEIH